MENPTVHNLKGYKYEVSSISSYRILGSKYLYLYSKRVYFLQVQQHGYFYSWGITIPRDWNDSNNFF